MSNESAVEVPDDGHGTQMLHAGITDRILGAAVAVHKALGPGLAERSY
jgi:hypothetical protein